ncbi:Protein RIC-4 a [Aphelenchoides avenae]|nr:Protein RIC-4 a [Aphelenchus avenae]
MAGNDDVPDSLEGINFKIHNIADESLESTRRMRGLVDETKELALKTIINIDDQGEQIDRAEKMLDEINEDMMVAEEHLKGMEKCCGLFILPWKKSDDFKNDPGYIKAFKQNDEGGVVNDSNLRMTVGDPTCVQGGYVTKILNDAREEEMDENLQEVNTVVGNLRNMAIDIGTELSNQNRQLERIHLKADSNDARVGSANKRTTKLAHK